MVVRKRWILVKKNTYYYTWHISYFWRVFCTGNMWAFQKLIVAIAGYIPRYSSLFKNIYCCTWHISLYFWMGFLCCQKAVLGNNKLFLFYLFLGRSFACEDSLFSFFLFIKCFCFSFFGKNICPDKRIYETLKSAREDVKN